MTRQCQFQVKRPPAHQCAKVAKTGSDFCQHHEKEGYAERSIYRIDWGGVKAAKSELLESGPLAERERLLREVIDELAPLGVRRALEIALSWMALQDLRNCAECQRHQDKGPDKRAP